MKVHIYLIVLCMSSIYCLSIVPEPKTIVEVGKLKLSIKELTSSFVSPTFQLAEDTWSRYKDLILYMKTPPTTGVTVDVAITLTTNDEHLSEDTVESYMLSLDENGLCAIQAENVFGMMKALETLSQIIYYSEDGGTYEATELPIIIQDEPRFKWRGLMIDSARHFLPISAIKRTIDGMSYNKLNVLHWHLIDAQSFPIEVTGYPDLADKGAYGMKYKYTHAEVIDLVSYAKARGIRIVPEFDMPGHSGFRFGAEHIVVLCPDYLKNVNNIPLNPTLSETYSLLGNFFADMRSIFPDARIHLGGDEVVYGCWEEMPAIKTWMESQGMKDVHELTAYFWKRVIPLLMDTKPVFWQEVFQNAYDQVPSDAIIQAWINQKELGKIVAAGYNGILSGGWYLDRQIPGQPTHYLWGDTWENFYDNEPTSGIDEKYVEKIMGGEGCMWGEQVDESDIDVRVWPRTCAIAERLWSQKGVLSHDDAQRRIDVHRCRMLRRGISASPLRPGPPCHIGS